MRLSRKITAEFAGVFLIGIAVGGLVMWDFTDTNLSQFMNKTNDPDSIIVDRVTKKYMKDYQLSQEELDKVQPLIKQMAQRVSQTRHQFGVDIMSALDIYHQQIAAQLTPEHREAYEKANEVRRKQLRSLLLLDQNSSSQP